VLLNNNVPQITTPYMRFYELEALCSTGEQRYVLQQIKDYWGAMLQLGATSFWEAYDPAETGAAHYAMYGRPFGKSLCHAWGASPIYLLGKYYLGVRPLSPGYSRYLVEPVLGGLQWMEGTVPVPNGSIRVYCSTSELKLSGSAGTGVLRFRSRIKPVCDGAAIKATGPHQYEMVMEKNKTYHIQYEAE
jgi:hypothetical protein